MTLIDEIGSEMQEINSLHYDIKTESKEYFRKNEKEMAQKQFILWFFLTKGRMSFNKRQRKKLNIIFSIFWEYYKRRKNLSKYTITMKDFCEMQEKHISFMKYNEGESDPEKKEEAFYLDLSQVTGRALDVWIYLYWDSSKALKKLGKEVHNEFIVDFRALINTFDKLEAIS